MIDNNRYIVYVGSNGFHFVSSETKDFFRWIQPDNINDFYPILTFDINSVSKAFNKIEKMYSRRDISREFKIINYEELQQIKNEFLIKEIIE